MALTLQAESWIWYGIVISIVVLRYVSRLMHAGSLRKLQIEDLVMVFVAVCYTVLIVYLNKVNVLPTNLIPPDQVAELDPSTIPARIEGSKLVIVVEQFWCATIWSCKACLLLLYNQMTTNSKHRYLVYAVSAYTAFGYFLMVILFFGAWCRPFPQYWAVPVKDQQCATYHDHLIVNTVFNISSDVMMLCIPLPLFIRMKLPLKKKIILCLVFSLGAFVIICAILSKYYSFHLPYGVNWVYWYVREVSTAVIVANVPHCWVLVRRVFNVRAFLSGETSATRSRGGTNTYNRDGLKSNSGYVATTSHRNSNHSQWYKMKMISHVTETSPSPSLSRSESEERINAKPLEIYQNTHYSVHGESTTRGEKVSDVDSLEKGEGKASTEFDGPVRDQWQGTQTTVTAMPSSHVRR